MNLLILRSRIFLVLALLFGAFPLSCQRSDMEQYEKQPVELLIESEFAEYREQSPYASTLGASKASGSLSQQDILPHASGSWGQVDSTLGVWHTSTTDNIPMSKATEVAWEVGDVMGLYIHSAEYITESNIKYGCANMEYTATSPTQWATDVLLNPPFLGLYATAYYPHQITIASPMALAHSVKIDQSTKANYTSSDLMATNTSSPIDGANMANVHTKLKFSHLFSKFVVKFEVPASIDGQSVIGVKSVLFSNFLTSATLNLATSEVGPASHVENITPYAAVAGTTAKVMVQYEAVVAPQTLTKGTEIISVVFSTSGGNKMATYKVPSYTGDQDMVFASGGKYELTLEAANSLAFLTQADFLDGLAKTLPIKIKVYKNQPWSLSSAEPWCLLSFSETSGFASSLTRLGPANDGGEVSVYVKVLGNTTSADGWADRRSVLTLKNISTGAQVVMPVAQGYSRWEIPANPSAQTAVEQSIVAPAFVSNKPWYATIAPAAMAKLNWQGGAASDRFPLVGQHLGTLLSAINLKYDLQPNNTDTDRAASITYMPTTKEGGEDVITDKKIQTVTQLKPAVTDFVHTLVGMTPSAGAFTSAAMNVTPGKGLQWKMSSGDPTNLTINRTAPQTALAADVAVVLTTNNGDAERTLYYSLNYGALSGALQTKFSIRQAAPLLSVSTNKTVAPHITSDTFQLTSASNQQGVQYVLSKSANITSTVPAVGARQIISGTANLNQRVDIAFPTNTGAARTHTVTVSYGASLLKSYTVTQEASSLVLNGSSYNIGVEGGVISSVALTSNVPYTAAVISPNGGSISPTAGNSPPYSPQQFTLTIPAQPQTASSVRTHTFLFTPMVDYLGNSQQRVFTVNQAERPVTISLSSYGITDIPYAGGTYDVYVTSNCSWSVTSNNLVSYSPGNGGAGTTLVRATVSDHKTDTKRYPSLSFTTTNVPQGLTAKTVRWDSSQKANVWMHGWFGSAWFKDYYQVVVWSNSNVRIFYYDSDTKEHLSIIVNPVIETDGYFLKNIGNTDANVRSMTLIDEDGKDVFTMNMWGYPERSFRFNHQANCGHKIVVSEKPLD